MKFQKMIPSKVKPNNLGDRFPYTSLFDALKTSQELQMMVFSKYGYRCLVELFLSSTGRRIWPR